MHNRLWIAGILAATPILALSPAAFPASNEAGCVRSVAGARYNQRLFASLMRRKDAFADRTLSTYGVERVNRREVRPVTDPVVCADLDDIPTCVTASSYQRSSPLAEFR